MNGKSKSKLIAIIFIAVIVFILVFNWTENEKHTGSKVDTVKELVETPMPSKTTEKDVQEVDKQNNTIDEPVVETESPSTEVYPLKIPEIYKNYTTEEGEQLCDNPTEDEMMGKDVNWEAYKVPLMFLVETPEQAIQHYNGENFCQFIVPKNDVFLDFYSKYIDRVEEILAEKYPLEDGYFYTSRLDYVAPDRYPDNIAYVEGYECYELVWMIRN